MNTVYFDAAISDDERRRQLFDGQLHVYSATAGSQALVAHAARMIREAFGDLDPELAQYHMPAGEYAAVLSELKPKFIHHPESKAHIQRLLGDLNCDLDRTYFDVPRMRTATSDAYLTTGIAYAFHPHGTLVLRAALPAELVDPDLRDRIWAVDGLPSSLLVAGGQERIQRL